MKPAPRLRLEPRPSRFGGLAVAAGCAATSVLLALLPLPIAAVVPIASAILGVLWSGLRRCAGRGVPALLHVGLDRRITVTDRDGRSCDGAILDDSYVGAWLTTIVWRADGTPWWHPARAIVVLPDTLPEDDFRRLRVALRYGRPAAAGGTSAEEAG
jgi:hypothetical protein